MAVCSECGNFVGSCERCGKPLRIGDLSTCGILCRPGVNRYHSHIEPEKCAPLRERVVADAAPPLRPLADEKQEK